MQESNIAVYPGRNFGTQAADFEKGRSAYGESLLDYVSRKIQELNPNTCLAEIPVIDLGSGTGKSTEDLYKKGLHRIRGLDLDLKMLDTARKKANLQGNFVEGEVANLPSIFPDEKFKIVTAFTAFHWFYKPNEVSAIKTVMASDAVFIVVTKSDRKDYSEAQKKFFKMMEQIKGCAMHNPYKDFYPVKVLEECGFEVDVKYFLKETYYDSETLKARARSASGWCNLTPDQKLAAEPELENLVQTLLKEQGNENNLIREETEEMCLIGRLKY